MIIVDSREIDLHECLKARNIEFQIEHLALGDVICNDILFERKTTKDLKASICDGRFEEQRSRLREYKTSTNKSVGYIFEGTADVSELKGGVAAALASVGLEFIVISSANVDTTAYQLQKILNGQNSHKTTENVQVSQFVSKYKINNMTPQLCLQILLMTIPGIGQVTAKSIATQFNSVADLIHNFHSRKIKTSLQSKIDHLIFGAN